MPLRFKFWIKTAPQNYGGAGFIEADRLLWGTYFCNCCRKSLKNLL
jgi:hypothetical protein